MYRILHTSYILCWNEKVISHRITLRIGPINGSNLQNDEYLNIPEDKRYGDYIWI